MVVSSVLHWGSWHCEHTVNIVVGRKKEIIFLNKSYCPSKDDTQIMGTQRLRRLDQCSLYHAWKWCTWTRWGTKYHVNKRVITCARMHSRLACCGVWSVEYHAWWMLCLVRLWLFVPVYVCLVRIAFCERRRKECEVRITTEGMLQQAQVNFFHVAFGDLKFWCMFSHASYSVRFKKGRYVAI